MGISTAHYLKKMSPGLDVTLVDSGPPMGLTSAQSGENYRNWWPHPIMTAFTNRSIEPMEEIANETGNVINLTRRGYSLVTRSDNTDDLMEELARGYADAVEGSIRFHDRTSKELYFLSESADWRLAPSGVDVITDVDLIRNKFPSYDHTVCTLVHIRRAGSLSGQQLGQYMLERFRESGGKRIIGEVSEITASNGFRVRVGPHSELGAERVVNAAGPFVNEIAQMLGTQLPIKNTLQQKLAFEDKWGVIPRNMPFSIDLDSQLIDWSNEELELLGSAPELKWLTEKMPGAIHCRPDGGDQGRWIKMGWAFNDTPTDAIREPMLTPTFPEIVLRGASRLNPGLKKYQGRLFRSARHYGGYYTLTKENWPLVGEMEIENTFVVGALSGFGTMSACAAGELCASWVLGGEKPHYASALSFDRYNNQELMAEMNALSSKGIL